MLALGVQSLIISFDRTTKGGKFFLHKSGRNASLQQRIIPIPVLPYAYIAINATGSFPSAAIDVTSSS